jgi:hypothetical protein
LPALISALQEREEGRATLQGELFKLDYTDQLSEIDEHRLARDLEEHLPLYWREAFNTGSPVAEEAPSGTGAPSVYAARSRWQAALRVFGTSDRR